MRNFELAFTSSGKMPWDLSFEEFIGVSVRIDDAYEIDGNDLEFLHLLEESDPAELDLVLEDEDGYCVYNHSVFESSLVLISPEGMNIGMMVGSRVWVSPEYRGEGLSVLLVSAQAVLNEGSPNVDKETGYSKSGYYAHKSAYNALLNYNMENMSPTFR